MNSQSYQFNGLLDLIEEATSDELRMMPSADWIEVMDGLTTEQKKEIIFRKNIKIFGGINEYVNDIFNKNSINRIIEMPQGEVRMKSKIGMLEYIKKLLNESGLSDENKSRLVDAKNRLESLNAIVAPAAGGKRGRRHRNLKTRKNKN